MNALQNGLGIPEALKAVLAALMAETVPAHWCVHVQLHRERNVSGPDGGKVHTGARNSLLALHDSG